MTHSPLHGLNIVQPDSPQDHYITDQQDLLSNPHFPDLAAQLDLWSNLTFQTDEPLITRSGRTPDDDPTSPLGDDEKEEEADPEGPASLEGHVNAVNPIAVRSAPAQQQQQQLAFDMNAILAGFGIDPFLVPQVSAPQPSQAASLAQLLAAYPFAPPPFFNQTPGVSAAPFAAQQPQATTELTSAPVKRHRSRKASSATAGASRSPASTVSPIEITSLSAADAEAADGEGEGEGERLPLSASEDKRRRNTAASARFRLKKKEREAALERRSKDLEVRVGELERECEALRRENGWLKGLVVGVTGASAQVGSSAGAGAKRKRGSEEERGLGGEGKKAVAAL